MERSVPGVSDPAISINCHLILKVLGWQLRGRLRCRARRQRRLDRVGSNSWRLRWLARKVGLKRPPISMVSKSVGKSICPNECIHPTIHIDSLESTLIQNVGERHDGVFIGLNNRRIDEILFSEWIEHNTSKILCIERILSGICPRVGKVWQTNDRIATNHLSGRRSRNAPSYPANTRKRYPRGQERSSGHLKGLIPRKFYKAIIIDNSRAVKGIGSRRSSRFYLWRRILSRFQRLNTGRCTCWRTHSKINCAPAPIPMITQRI